MDTCRLGESSRMEKKKILIKSNIAASNLLRTLHSLYQFGHFCDVTIHTDQRGMQEDFFVHKAVLAASSNYFRSLFLANEKLNAKNCRVTLHGVHAEEFVSFLRFVYTTEVEVEVDKLHRIKEVAERLECKDLLEVFEEMKSIEEDMDLSAHSKSLEIGRSLRSETEHMKVKEQNDLTQILAKPMKRNLWDRKRQGKPASGHEITDDKSGHSNKDGAVLAVHKDETEKSTGCNKIATSEALSRDDVSHGETKTSQPSLSKVELKESCIVLSSTLPDQTEDKGLNYSETKLRKSPRNLSKVVPYACDKCQLSFHFAKQYQLHMELQHDTRLIIKYSCNMCDQLFPSFQNLKQHRLAVHSREQCFPCLLCNRKFKHQMGVNDHIQRVHEKKRNPQRCPYCDKVIGSKCGLTVHLRTHTGEKPYKCECCPASFAQRSAFNTHVRKMHALSQDKKLMSSYCMLVPPRERPDIIEGGIDMNCQTCHEIPSNDLQRQSVTETSHVLEKEFRHSRMLEATSDHKDEGEVLHDEMNLQEAMSVEDGVNGNGDCKMEVGGSSNPEVISSEDDRNSNDQDEAEYKSDADSKVRRKVNKSEIAKKSAYVITCTKCVETFLSRKKYIDHCQEVHHFMPGKIYQCDICSKSFASYNSWKEHRASVHTEDRQFACTLCNATFKRKRDVRTHYVRKHEGRVKRPLCSVCGKILSSRTALVFHMRTHTGEKPYQCSICCSRFAQPSQLKIHTRSHTGEKPYICEDCGACFADKGKLNGHKRTHTGERLFRCDVCEKHFATNEYLKCHKRCHMGAKPYKCNVCGKTFGLRASLAQHSNVHAETPPYFCEQCGKTFTQQGALRRHQRIHTGEKPYKCRACERTFTDMSTLRRHVLVHDRNAHWRSFLIDLTIKKDHNWSKIETLSNICMGEDSTSVWSGGQSKPNKPGGTNGKITEHISCNSNVQESDHPLTYL